MYKKLLIFLLLLNNLTSHAQRNCGTPDVSDALLNSHRSLSGRYGNSNSALISVESLNNLPPVIIIPVAVHILYKQNEENISDALLQAQIDELNKDFSNQNDDLDRVAYPFKILVNDPGPKIRFELKKVIRKPTQNDHFLIKQGVNNNYVPANEPIKFAQYGGDNGLAYTQYLNIWIGNITDGSNDQLLGYATFPGGIGKFDGVVIYYQAIGPSNLMPQFNKGRTLTHEVGHWLNLRHIWGDSRCGNDLVSDTPTQETNNVGKPTFPSISCNNSPNGDMFMNYMDYVDDDSMYMFTLGQKNIMRRCFAVGGQRSYFFQNLSLNVMISRESTFIDQKNVPVVTNLTETYGQINPQNVVKTINWTPVEGAQKYIVQSKATKSSNWSRIYTKDNHLKIAGLNSNDVYEVVIQAINDKGEVTPASVPYLYTLNKESVNIDHKLMLLK